MYMGLFQFLKKKIEKEEPWEKEGSLMAEPLNRANLDIENSEQREKYIRNCCQQIVEASEEIDKATMEYQLVTNYLTDMEEIEQLPKEERADINAYARKLVALKKDHQLYESKIGNITDAQFKNVERFEEDMPEGLEKLVKDENYKMLVRQDLQKLEGEKVSYQFRLADDRIIRTNAKSLAIITIFTIILTLMILFIFQYFLQMNTTIGYLLTIAIGAISLTYCFVRNNNAMIQQRKVERNLNQVILMQNTVKIRYINITNVIEYAYAKYRVNSSNELNYLWEKYTQEKEERKKFDESGSEIEFQKGAFLEELKRLRIRVPGIWLHQVEALIEPKEMVEIRHGLITRRQAMRKRIEYNVDNRNQAKEEVNEIVKSYPKYAKEILEIISEYE